VLNCSNFAVVVIADFAKSVMLEVSFPIAIYAKAETPIVFIVLDKFEADLFVLLVVVSNFFSDVSSVFTLFIPFTPTFISNCAMIHPPI